MSNSLEYEYSLPNDIFYTTDEIISKYGEQYKFFVHDTLLFKDREVYKKYMGEDVIEFTKLGKQVKASKRLLLDFLSNNGMYKYLLAHMDNPQGIALKVGLFENGDVSKTFTLTRANYAELLNKIDIREMTPLQQMRKSLINNLSTTYSLNQKYKDEIHTCNIDGEYIEIDASSLLEILEMPNPEYLQFLNGVKNYKYPKEIMAYALIDFIQRERILEKYRLEDVSLNRFKSIESLEVIDFEYINKNQKTNDYDADGKSLVEQVNINTDFYNEVMKDINPSYSSLEKAMYIYIKMCDLLTYDPSFFASNQRGIDTKKHEDLMRLSTINKSNNSVVCYEFTMIYAKFLSDLNINYTIDSALVYGYGGGHAKLSFRVSEYLISADSVESIITNDMANIKINEPVKGLRSLNKNIATKNKFNELLYKVFVDYINKKENNRLFEQSLREYKEKYASVQLDTKEKLQIMLKELARSDLKGLDTISYQYRIYKNIFSQLGSVSINFLSSSINTKNDEVYAPITIVTVLTIDGYKYLLIDPNSPDIIESITDQELSDMFESGYYAYLNDKTIPGLELKGDKSYVR